MKRREVSSVPNLLAWLPLALPVFLKLAVHLPLIERYGYHRDELYFIDCGRHLALGYVDHAPFVPWIAALSGWLFDHDLAGLRIFSVFAGAAATLLTGLLARELGGRGGAQLLAGFCVVIAPAYLRMGKILCIPSFELLWWTLAAWLLARRIRTGDLRLWLPVGAALGLGLLTKHSTLLWGLGLAIGTIASPLRRDLRTRWPWMGVAIALLLFFPNVVWQIENGWPTLEFIRAARQGMLAQVGRELFLLGQLLYMSPFTIPVWGAGLVRLLRHRERDEHVFGWAFVVVLGLLLTTRAKPYYLAAAYPVLFASGAVAFEALFARRRWRWAMPVTITGLGVAAALAVVVSLPVMSLERTDRVAQRLFGAIVPAVALTHDLHDEHGWPEQVAQIARYYKELPAADQRIILLAGNYGEASAVHFFGPAHGLPRAYSGHMTHYFWADGDLDAPRALAWGLPRAKLDELFFDVHEVGRVQHALAMESDVPIYDCRNPKRPLTEAWPDLRWFGTGLLRMKDEV